MEKMKKLLAVLSAVLCMGTAAGCSFDKQTAKTEQSSDAAEYAAANTETPEAETLSNVETEPDSEVSSAERKGAELSKADLNTEWGSDAVEIRFSDDKIECTADGVTVTDNAVRITKGGDYVLSGSRDHTAVIVDLADQKEKVHLVLNGLSLKTSDSAPITVVQADKTVITLADGTSNALCDARAASTDESVPFACIASNDDLTINGSGTLSVESKAGTGIQSSDDLKIAGGTVTVSAGNHGLRGNDSVLLYAGTLDISADGDGIKSTNADKEGKGWILAEGGTVTVNAKQDGMDAASALEITGGTLDITAGGGAPETVQSGDSPFGGGSPFGRGKQEKQTDTEQSSSGSSKGIKAETSVTVSGGTVTISASDDAVHTNGDAVFSGDAVLTAASGDDGIHADAALTFAGGDIRITKSNEGIEAAAITVSGGSVRVKAADDGVNASDGSGGGMGFNRNGTGTLTISGGYLY
ncbi:MAG: carbohydrate-binding domain-containing protein, partial [Oscillospiraceae bacterium]|nr:carbohydrate-binding domain-containing protein [Oscillospiraceae bacterium]